MAMVKTTNLPFRVYPYNGDVDPAQINRLQNFNASLSLNREKIKEIGRDGIISWRKRIPTCRATGMQYEYGSIEFWNKLANKADDTTSLSLSDFDTSMVDICGFETDDSGTFLGTVWYPKLRLNGFSLNIGDPESYIERSFDMTGEDEKTLLYGNKYFIFRKFTASGGTNEEITISDGTAYPHPAEDPDNSGYYLLRVLRVRDGVTTELTYTTDYTYNNSTHIMTVVSATAGDIYKVYWSAATLGTGTTIFTNNDSEPSALTADCTSIFLQTSNRVYKLQSVGIDASFDRTDYKEIGSTDVVQRGVRDRNVTVTLGRILESYTTEEIFRGVSGYSYGIINPRNFADDITLTVKVYSDNTKSTFKMRYDITDLSPVSLDFAGGVDDYIQRSAQLAGQGMTIKSVDA